MNDWKVLAEEQAIVIEDLAKMCRELTDELLKYRNTDEIDAALEEMLGRRCVL